MRRRHLGQAAGPLHGGGRQVLAEAEPQISVLFAPNPLVPEP